MLYIKYFIVFLFSKLIELNAFEELARCGYTEEGEDKVDRVHFPSLQSSSKKGRSMEKKGNLRIKVFYDTSVEQLSPKRRDIVETVVQTAVRFWSEALVVTQLPEPIKMKRGCHGSVLFYPKPTPVKCCQGHCMRESKCGESRVPEEHLEPCLLCSERHKWGKTQSSAEDRGVKYVDFVVYVSARASYGCSGGAAAHAKYCAQEAHTDRPIAGNVNVCPSFSDDLKMVTQTVKHELLHALGFSRKLFFYYRDKSGEPLVKRDRFGYPIESKAEGVIFKTIQRKWKVHGNKYVNKKVLYLITPRVVKEVRDHFGCSSLEGAELEDQGGEGTKDNHWEKRLFQDEGMAGIGGKNRKFTRVTFAALEDSGWYEPNYDLAESSTWGKGLGCDFVKRSCKDWMDFQKAKGEDSRPYCTEHSNKQLICSHDRSILGSCRIVAYGTRLPQMYQNFDQLAGVRQQSLVYYGGKTQLADYCPVMEPMNWIGRLLNCEENGFVPSDNHYLESFGDRSKCFEFGSQRWTSITHQSFNDYYSFQTFGRSAGCYKYSCNGGRIHIKILDKDYPCFYKGQEIPLKLQLDQGHFISGSIICPACSELCKRCKKDDQAAGDKHKYDNIDLESKLQVKAFYRILGTLAPVDHKGVNVSTEATTADPHLEESRKKSKISPSKPVLNESESSTDKDRSKIFSIRPVKRKTFKLPRLTQVISKLIGTIKDKLTEDN